jgi:hypothetical protein
MAGFKNGNPGCCCASNTCACTWPTTLSYIGTVAMSQSGFYFADVYRTGDPVAPRTTTLTYGPPPSDVPGELLIEYISAPGGTSPPYWVTLADNAWWSGPIPAYNFSAPINAYFYLWFKGCSANVMLINAPYSTGTAPADTKGAASKNRVYQAYTCTPFAMRSSPFVFVPEITGTHGGGDIIPDATGSSGEPRNGRNGLPTGSYTVGMTSTHPHGTTPGSAGAQAFIAGPNLGGWTPGPGDTVAWASSNTSVLTVAGHGGLADLTLIAPGTATISAVITTTRANPTNQPGSVSFTVT